jgi:CBS-domain-containing membrane protein
MSESMESLEPSERDRGRVRRRLGVRGEIALALLPTVTILVVLGLVEVFSRQRLLFASLAASAFLIYLDPEHGTNRVRTLVLAQLLAAGIGWIADETLGTGYVAAGLAMVVVIVVMVIFDTVHPPAVSTSLAFGLRGETESNLVIFGLAVGMTAVLVLLEQSTLRLLLRISRHTRPAHEGKRGGP